jgi:50S ribosomal subunit-associated GTPase HflX
MRTCQRLRRCVTQKPEVMQRRRRGSILRSMSKQMEERVALLGLSKAGKTTLVEQLAYADPIKITTTPTTPHDGSLHTHNPTDNMMMVSRAEALASPAAPCEAWIAAC